MTIFFSYTNHKPTGSAGFLFAFVLTCLGLLQGAHAVVPAPDGGYPGGNTAEGQSALFSLTTGGFNTAAGFLSLRSNTAGSSNTAIGAGALLANIGDNNTATGTGALLSNTTGPSNTANGAFALFSNTTGFANTAIGFEALLSNTTAAGNTAVGDIALLKNTTGSGNTATGAASLQNNTTGGNNTAIGFEALASNNDGDQNTAIGDSALHNNTNGLQNTAIGADALDNNTTGLQNTAIGAAALHNNTTGFSNTALGLDAGLGVTTASDVICIRANGANVDQSCFIGNIRGKTTANNDAIPVLIDSNFQLGTQSSSRRFKKEIQPMDKASETILALKPVTFHYKNDKTNRPEFGLIAEQVAEVSPDLVVRDKNGEIYTVRYDAVNAMLLNEFIKEHRKVQKLEAQVEKLTAGFQKVSDQLELRKRSLHLVLDRN